MRWPPQLEREAELDGYIYFDQNIRPLPKSPDGSIDTMQPGFQYNDVDAFRHAYVSGIMALEYGENAARFLGWMNELVVIGSSAADRNMDFWNNAVGRELVRKHGGQQVL